MAAVVEWTKPTSETIDRIISICCEQFEPQFPQISILDLVAGERYDELEEISKVFYKLHPRCITEQPVVDSEGLTVGLYECGVSFNGVFQGGSRVGNEWTMPDLFGDFPMVLLQSSLTGEFAIGFYRYKTFEPLSGITTLWTSS